MGKGESVTFHSILLKMETLNKHVCKTKKYQITSNKGIARDILSFPSTNKNLNLFTSAAAPDYFELARSLFAQKRIKISCDTIPLPDLGKFRGFFPRKGFGVFSA
jgi:hypothetical protein